MLGRANGFTAFDDTWMHAFGWLFGWVGDPALGEEAQSLTRRLTSATKLEKPDRVRGVARFLTGPSSASSGVCRE